MGAVAAIPAILAVGTSLLQARSQIVAGKVQEAEAETAARQEELAAVQREADRKGRLSRALASQIATTGAGGLASFEGSPLTILQESIETEERATERDVFETRLAALSGRARGKVARRAAREQALIGLAGSLTQAAKTFPAPKDTTTAPVLTPRQQVRGV